MRRPSGFVVFLLLGALVTTMCAGGMFFYATRMPDPTTTDLRGLFRWLVTRDLSRERTEVQEQLLARLERELRGGLELGDTRAQLSDAQRQQLLENADLLGRLWFSKQVDRYFAQADAERQKFLNKQLDELQEAGIAKALAALVAESDTSAKNLWADLSARVQRWTATLSPEKQTQAQQFIAAVQGNMLLRTLRVTFGSSGQAKVAL